jgi:N-acetylglucosamine-6-sulfatase
MRPARIALLLVAGGLIAAMLSVVSSSATARRGAAGGGHQQAAPLLHPRRPVTARTARRPPNIVFVLTDDLSMNLMRFMPQVQALQALQARGMSATDGAVRPR